MSWKMLPGSEKIVEAIMAKPEFRAKRKGNDIWLCCPLHGDGRERTPSRRVNLSNEKYELGFSFCYSCSERQALKWEELASDYNLPYANINKQNSSKSVMRLDRDELFGKSKTAKFGSLPWPKEKNWRGIKGSLIKKLGGTLHLNRGEFRLNMPVYLHGELRGNVDCDIEGTSKYKYLMDGSFVKIVPYPYDYIKDLKPKVLLIGEGLRDALNPLQYGIPSLCIFGASNWSIKKARLIADLEVDLIIDALDADEAGQRVAEKVRGDMAKFAKIKRLKLPEGGDPGAMTKKAILKLKEKLDFA